MVDDSFSSVITSAKHVLVVLPNNPDLDQVAAGLSLYLSLMDKSSVEIYCETPMNVEVNRLVGVNRIRTEVGNKNLTIKFKDYDATNIEKVSYDIENGEFKLTIVPKTTFTSPSQENIDLSYSGISADLLILIGGVTDSDFPILSSEELTSAKIAHIGTRSPSFSRDSLSFAKPSSSVSELVAGIIKENSLEMNQDTATNLVMGIEEGSGHFESSEVTPDTFEAFAYLLRSGGQRLPKQKFGPQGFPPGSVPGQPIFTTKPETNAAQGVVDGDEEGQDNAPDEWLQPKVYKGSTQVSSPDSFSENKG